MADQRRRIGALETWHTRAKRQWRDAAGSVGATVWLCPKCGYWPCSDATLPARTCFSCGEQWASSKEDSEATPLVVRVTDYGYELVSVGRLATQDDGSVAMPQAYEVVHFRRRPDESEDKLRVPVGTAEQHIRAELITRIEPPRPYGVDLPDGGRKP